MNFTEIKSEVMKRMGIASDGPHNNLNAVKQSLETIRYEPEPAKKGPTLVKEIMSDLETGNRVEEQLRRMRLQEFNDGHRPVVGGVFSSVSMEFSTSTMQFRPGGIWPTESIGG